ncbi:MAG: HAMP domain-containing histidine kinase [Elusimicrobia bacterium]|nr:HAMP domain-containing histidine kinase [Elusimicrobiota bacterium]
MTLRTRFMLYVAGLTVGSFVLYAGALSWTQREILEQEQDRANREESGRWTLLCEQSVLSKDEITLIHYVRELLHSDDVRWASFLATDGRVMMHTELSLKNSVAIDAISHWARGLDRPGHRVFPETEGTPLVVYAGPVNRGGERVGVALLAFDGRGQKDRVHTALAASLQRFGGATVVCLVIGVLVSMGVARGLVWPLNELTLAVRRLGRGDWGAKPSVTRRDEIGELASAFREMSRRLAKLDELKDEFVATVSHDLRNPLGAITMATKYLMDPPAPLSKESHQQILATILVSTARLRNMVDNILDAAKIKQGLLDSLTEDFSMNKVIRELRDLFRSQAEEFDRDFRLVTTDDLPLVRGDESQTYRILSNLLSNAFKFTSSGDAITLSAEATPPGAVTVTVSDTGPGIPARDLPHLFHRFKTAENAGRDVKKQQGTGLGLAIALSLTEAQGGQLTVSSEQDQGTTFRFTLPQSHPT